MLRRSRPTVSRAAGTDNFRQWLREELGSVRDELISLRDKLQSELGPLRGELHKEQRQVRDEQRQVRDMLNAMERQLGSVVEHPARVQAEKLHGRSYQRPLLALPLQVLALLLTEEAVFRDPLAKEPLRAPLGPKLQHIARGANPLEAATQHTLLHPGW